MMKWIKKLIDSIPTDDTLVVRNPVKEFEDFCVDCRVRCSYGKSWGKEGRLLQILVTHLSNYDAVDVVVKFDDDSIYEGDISYLERIA